MENDYNAEPSVEQPSRPRWSRWVLYGALALGVFLFVTAAASFLSTYNKRKALVETQSTIVDFNGTDFPILEYTVDGQTYRVRSNYMSSDMQAGQSIRVLYDPADPSNANTRVGDYTEAIFLTVVGVVCVGIPLLILAELKRGKRKREEAAAQALYDGKPVETEPEDSIFSIILRNLFFWIGLLFLGLTVLFVILQIIEPESHNFIAAIAMGFIGVTFTAIGVFIRRGTR